MPDEMAALAVRLKEKSPGAPYPDVTPNEAKRCGPTSANTSKRGYPSTNMQPESNALRPVSAYLPDWSPRRINDACRAKRIPGVVKVGRMWMLRPSDFERWVTGAVATDASPTIDDAAAELRRRGVI